MFANLTYLHIHDNEFNDKEVDEDHSEEPWVVDMCKLMTLNDTFANVEKNKITTNLQVHPPPRNFFVQMDDVMQKIINKMREGGVQLIDHTIVACYCNRCTRYSPFQGK
jgi:hypothetical protein